MVMFQTKQHQFVDENSDIDWLTNTSSFIDHVTEQNKWAKANNTSGIKDKIGIR